MPFLFPPFLSGRLLNYAGDNYTIQWNANISTLVIDMKKPQEGITKWLKDSGLKVNEKMIEMCVFHGSVLRRVILTLIGTEINSTPQIKVLGVMGVLGGRAV